MKRMAMLGFCIPKPELLGDSSGIRLGESSHPGEEPERRYRQDILEIQVITFKEFDY
jgi:hypothetical protein